MAVILNNVLKQLDLLMQAGKPVEEDDFNIQEIGCAARSMFLLRTEPERSEEIANREGVASGSATNFFIFLHLKLK